MNKTYRLIWNELSRAWVAVSEIAQARGKRASGTVLLAALGLVAVLPASTFAQVPPAPTALPTGGQVVAGQASIAPPANNALTITQTSQRAAIDWQTFNVGSAASVNFIQPSSSATILNRVLDPNPSQIFGRINANGQVFLTNASGIYFSPGASVNVGALTATTHSISNADFMAGNYRFTRNGATGSVINEGNLTAGLGGYIALLAPEVRNQGVIVAQMGTVALAAGEAVELQFDGNNALANIRVEPSNIHALVENGNAVQAPGGLIILSANAASQLQGGIVKQRGSLEASSLTSQGGRILLEGDDITLGAVKPPPPPKVPPVEYYVSVDDKPTGPFPCAKILEMAKARTVTPETKIWKAGMESWQRAASFEDLRPIFAVVPPPVDGDLPRFVDVSGGDVPIPCPPPDDGKSPWWWPLPWWPFKVK